MTTNTRSRRRRRVAWAQNPKLIAGAVLVVSFRLIVLAHPDFQNTIWEGERTVYDPFIGYDAQVVHPSGPTAAHRHFQ